MAQIFLDLCLSDIPKERIKRANNGKAYVKLNLSELRHADAHGNDHCISVYVPKDERGDKPIYVGKGRSVRPTNGESAGRQSAPTHSKDDDLGF